MSNEHLALFFTTLLAFFYVFTAQALICVVLMVALFLLACVLDIIYCTVLMLIKNFRD